MVILPVVKKIGPMYFYFTSKGIARSSKKRVACLTHKVRAIHMSGTQRSYQRWLDKIIYKTEMKFWAVWEHKNLEYSFRKKLTPFWAFFSKLLLLLLFKSILDEHEFLKPRSSSLHFGTPVYCKAGAIEIQIFY